MSRGAFGNALTDDESNELFEKWTIPSLNLRFTVTLAGGSFADCDSWYILLEPAGKPS